MQQRTALGEAEMNRMEGKRREDEKTPRPTERAEKARKERGEK